MPIAGRSVWNTLFLADVDMTILEEFAVGLPARGYWSVIREDGPSCRPKTTARLKICFLRVRAYKGKVAMSR
jgi:hypothetical protein